MKVPRNALNINPSEDSSFELLAEGEGDKRKKFRMVANSGGVIPNHPHWGNFAIDLEGMNIGRVRKPALRDHDPQRIVGHTYSIEVTDEGLVAEGTFSDTNDGREVMAMLADGFPWQASVYVPPQSIEKLDEGETAEVNGRTIQGPGHVFRQSSLREVTFTSLGADENTGAAALSEVTIDAVITAAIETEVSMEDQEVVEETTAQLSDVAEESPVAKLDDRVESETAAERDRVNALLSSALPDQFGLVQQLIADGLSKEDGLQKLMNDVKEKMSDKLAHKLSATPEPVGPLEEQTVDPREQFNADKELTAQFGTFEVYEAYSRAVEAGAVKGAK